MGISVYFFFFFLPFSLLPRHSSINAYHLRGWKRIFNMKISKIRNYFCPLLPPSPRYHLNDHWIILQLFFFLLFSISRILLSLPWDHVKLAGKKSAGTHTHTQNNFNRIGLVAYANVGGIGILIAFYLMWKWKIYLEYKL